MSEQLWSDERIAREILGGDTSGDMGKPLVLHLLTFLRDHYQVELNAAQQRIADLTAEVERLRVPQMPVPDWSNAPEWAVSAMVQLSIKFEDGRARLPFVWVYFGADGEFVDSGIEVDLPLGIDWRQTLTPRPQGQEVDRD